MPAHVKFKMAIPYTYTLKNLYTRKLTTLFTVTGMALVVYVFATVLMLSEGLERTLVATGSPDNVIVIRRASETEIQSTVDRDQAAIVESLPEIANSVEGKKLVSKELVVLVGLPKRGTVKRSNVSVRGLSEDGLRLRPRIQLMEGRIFRPGSSEIIIGNQIARGFTGASIGEKLQFGLREWTVVGIFNADNTSFSSEIWADVEQLMQAFRRNSYSSVIFKLTDPLTFEIAASRIDDDQRLTLQAKREAVFYAEQAEKMADFLRIFGITLSVIFSAGATIGAMITMHTSVASRTTEIGTLRAIGFHKHNILGAFLAESLALGLVGGILGVMLASSMLFLTISTVNWQTFSELAFTFVLTPAIIFKSFIFALLMGFIGGFLPAVRAAQMSIIDALKAV